MRMTILALVLAATFAGAHGALAAVKVTAERIELDNALVNGDFELGIPVTFDTSVSPANVVFNAIGSVLPGSTEDRAEIGPLGWTARVFSGQRTAFTSIRWGAGIGTDYNLTNPYYDVPSWADRSAAVEVTYDHRDREAETFVLTQAVGQRPHLGYVSGPKDVTFHARTPYGTPLSVQAGVYTVEDRHTLLLTNKQTITTAKYTPYALYFDRPIGTVTQFFLFFEGPYWASDQTVVYLDDLELNGAAVWPAADRGGSVVEPWAREVCKKTGVCA